MLRQLLLAVGIFSLSCHVEAVDMTPVTRVVQLLQGLAGKLEKGYKADEKAYEKHQCWCKHSIATWNEEVANFKVEKAALETTLENVQQFRVADFGPQQGNLQEEIKTIQLDLEDHKTKRNQEHKKYEDDKAENTASLSAISDAAAILAEVQGDPATTGSFLAKKVKLGVSDGIAESRRFDRAIKLGKEVLSDGEALFLERILSGEEPHYDHKQLNKDAHFKDNYKARSGNIYTILMDLKASTEATMTENDDKEAERQGNYEEMKTTKRGRLQDAQVELHFLTEDGAKKGQSEANLQADIDDYRHKIEDLEGDGGVVVGMIPDTEATCELATKNWIERRTLRTKEKTAIAEAIAILNADAARDTIRSSYKSQGYSFVQIKEHTSLQATLLKQLDKLQRTAVDERVKAIAERARNVVLPSAGEGGGLHEQILLIVEQMVSLMEDLKREESTELDTVAECKDMRNSNLNDAFTEGQHMDKATTEINTKLSEIIEDNQRLEASIKREQELVKQLDTAERNRVTEHDEWVRTNHDDEEAIRIVRDAKEVLEAEFGGSSEAMLLQEAKEVEHASPAPPPAPLPAYEGAKGQGNGIVSIMTMILDDMGNDKQEAEAAELDEVAAHQRYTTETESAIQGEKNERETVSSARAELEMDILGDPAGARGLQDERNVAHVTLSATLANIEEQAAACEFLVVNHPVRVANRRSEIDGLQAGHDILSHVAEDMADKAAALQRKYEAQEQNIETKKAISTETKYTPPP